MKRPLPYCLSLLFFLFHGMHFFRTRAKRTSLRFPDVHDKRVAFVYAGDIWIVGTEGGTARRLTSHSGLELFPKILPDGSKIAFTRSTTATSMSMSCPPTEAHPDN